MSYHSKTNRVNFTNIHKINRYKKLDIIKRHKKLDKIRNVIRNFKKDNCVLNMTKNDLDNYYEEICKEIEYTEINYDKNNTRLSQLQSIRDIILSITTIPEKENQLSSIDIQYKTDKILLPGWILIKNNFSNKMFDFIETNRYNQHFVWKITEGKIDETGMFIEFGIDSSLLECYEIKTIHNILIAILDKENKNWYVGRINQLKLENIYPWEKNGLKLVRINILQVKEYNEYIPPASILWCV